MKLLVAVVQREDLAKATSALVARGLRVTALNSTGGFLGRRSATLFCGLEPAQVDGALEALSQTCKGRTVEVQRGHPMFALMDKVRFGGAVVFVADLDRFLRIED